jgi:hypothetical protein
MCRSKCSWLFVFICLKCRLSDSCVAALTVAGLSTDTIRSASIVRPESVGPQVKVLVMINILSHVRTSERRECQYNLEPNNETRALATVDRNVGEKSSSRYSFIAHQGEGPQAIRICSYPWTALCLPASWS